MKSNLNLSSKINHTVSMKRTVMFISTGLCFFGLLFTGAFFYFNFGNSEEALANGEGTCKMVVSSGDTGYNKNFKPYKVSIEAEVIDIIPTTLDCTYGYNFNLEVAYKVIFEGPGKPKLDTFQGNIICDDHRLWFQFPPSVMQNGGTGTFITQVNPYRNANDCSTATPALLGCNNITITIGGEGIPPQSDIVCPNNSILPITLLFFTAQKQTNIIKIAWSTASEVNNDFFTIERSADGLNWETIKTLPGAGNSNVKLDYQYKDQTPLEGYNYYRLKQTDFNGNFEYFKIVAVNMNNQNYTKKDSYLNSKNIQAGPNPFKESVTITYTTASSDPVALIIRDITGTTVYKETLYPSTGENQYTYDRANQLKSGVYIINMIKGGKTATVKAIKI